VYKVVMQVLGLAIKYCLFVEGDVACADYLG
jgi:hypothetical protein